MDFDAAARDIFRQIEHGEAGHRAWLWEQGMPVFVKKLRDAYQAGQAEMRERAAVRGRIAQLEDKVVDIEIRELPLTEEGKP
jgi:hypothetical protein